MAGAPKKTKSTEARTAQTGMFTPIDYVGKQYITPKKGDDDDYDEENVVSVDVTLPTKEEGEIAARQEKVKRDIMTAKGRKHRKQRKTRKTKKVRKTKRRS